MDFNLRIPQAEEVKTHVRKHKLVYSIGATAVITATVSVLVTRQFGVRTISTTPIFNNIVSPTFNNDNSSLVNMGGHTTKMVKRLSDGRIWETVTQTAEDVNAPLSLMSRHLNGHKPDVYGDVYKIIGVGTKG